MSDKIKDVGHAMRILTGDAEVELTKEQYHLFDAAHLLIIGLERSVDIARDEATEFRARIAEIENLIETINDEHNSQSICAFDFAATHSENSFFRHRIAELEHQVESMQNKRDFMSDVLTSVVNEYTLFSSDEGPSDISDRHAKMVKEHWQPRGNVEGGEL